MKDLDSLGNYILSVRCVIIKRNWVHILLSIQYTLLIFYIKVKKQSWLNFVVNDTIIYIHICTFRTIISSVLAYEVIYCQLNSCLKGDIILCEVYTPFIFLKFSAFVPN